MSNLRSLLSWLLAGVLALTLVGCGGPAAVTPPPTYDADQIVQIQKYAPSILATHERFDELLVAIDDANWTEAQNLMRGPFGQMLQDMNYLSLHLLPSDQKVARKASRSIFEDFVRIDQAAADNNVESAVRAYDQVLADFEQFIKTVPETALVQATATPAPAASAAPEPAPKPAPESAPESTTSEA